MPPGAAGLDRRLPARVDLADVVQDAYLAARGKLSRDGADSRPPFFSSLSLKAGKKLADLHSFHGGTKMRYAGEEVSFHQGPLPQVAVWSLTKHLPGKLTTPSQAGMWAE